MEITILLFDGVNALDAVGPYEVLHRLPGARVRFVAADPGPKHTEDGALSLVADTALADLTHPEFTTSVCTCALLLACDDVARDIQLAIEYDPEPPFDSGAPHKAPPHLVERQRAASRFAE